MAREKVLVRNKETGATRPMTKTSFDLVGHKRGYEVVGPYVEEGKADPVQEAIARRKAEKEAQKNESATVSAEPDEQPEVKRRGRKPKTESDEA